jgi:hypothetical protein
MSAAEPGRLGIVREGHGEAGSIENLVVRTCKDPALYPNVFWSIPHSPRFAITSPETAVRAARIGAESRAAAVLLTADSEDLCPKQVAPVLAAAVRREELEVPVAIVLFYREFETLAVATADQLAGRELRSSAGQLLEVLSKPTEMLSDPESRRDAKGWVRANLMRGRAYKPTVHQLGLTRVLRIEDLRNSGLSSFRRLESALRFLGDEGARGTAGVYPGPEGR